MAVQYDISEVGGMARLILSTPGKAAGAGHDAAKKIGMQVRDRAMAAAPTDRPWLSKSGVGVRSWKFKDGSHTDVFTKVDPDGRPVGFFVEYGTHDTPPVPFLSSQMGWAADAFHEEVMRQLNGVMDGPL